MTTAMERLKEVAGEAGVEVFADIKKSTEEKIDTQVGNLKDKWDKLINQRLVYALLAIIGLAALATVTSLYTATKEVNQSVITLQDKILASQEIIRKSADQLIASNKALTEATDSLTSKTRELTAALKEVGEAKTALKTETDEMKRSTEELQRLRARQEPSAKAKP